MSSKFFSNKQDKSLPKKQGKANNKGKGAQKQVRKVGRGK